MITEEQSIVLVKGMNVGDSLVMIQIIDKALETGIISGKEVGFVALVRSKLINQVEMAIGFNVDAPVMPEQILQKESQIIPLKKHKNQEEC